MLRGHVELGIGRREFLKVGRLQALKVLTDDGFSDLGAQWLEHLQSEIHVLGVKGQRGD